MGSLPYQSGQPYDVLIIGAGLSGIYSLYQIRSRFPSWRVKVIEAGTDVGGVWYWNRYPGCQIDTESLSYCYSFDNDLLEEWDWKDTFAFQPDTHKYIQRVAEKHDLYKDIQFNTRIKYAKWKEEDHTWTFTDENSEKYTSRFFVSCLGFLSNPTLPAIPGIENFQGQAFHTSRWPLDLDITRDFRKKQVGVIGTGATGIQTITTISKADTVGSLTVFQRTANWSAPLRNAKITPEKMKIHKNEYNAMFKQCAETPSGFMHQADTRKSSEVEDEERVALWEKLYAEPGFGKWLGVFKDTYTDREANALYSDFMASKIRERVKDPSTADSLIPKDHGYGTRRVPLESGYFEAFNKPDVNLVDLKKTPITHVRKDGIETADGKHHHLDLIIYATGFDAITGAFNAIEWHGKDGRPLIAKSSKSDSLRPIWPDHRPSTYLGIHVHGLPNTFMVLGPHQPFGNATRSIEHTVDVICDLLYFCKENGSTYVEPKPDAVEKWTAHVMECSRGSMINEVDSWMTGVNTNVEGKNVKNVARYTGSIQEYKKWCRECRESGYSGLVFASK
ncbi:cyclohexanone monooxygenase [Corynespora cassiicola Philippines]|uniref:Cyclohexanone monooxygenase n=1 Tax=Corynespora cassiicola Philippines TaxID=1448308 RepID=A0A2T2N823_CORCC|nr:cyclohexanone monooxygenase [Corynespora cassiicola Philippines]